VGNEDYEGGSFESYYIKKIMVEPFWCRYNKQKGELQLPYHFKENKINLS
jgi:hypothetical protein